MLVLKMNSYTGLAGIPREFCSDADGIQEARDAIAGRLRRARRQGRTVTRLPNGTAVMQFEIGERPDAIMVDDGAGFLTLRHEFRYECVECGQQYDDRDALAECCNADAY